MTPIDIAMKRRSKSERMNAEKLALSKEAAEKSMVLLKNNNQALPLSADKKIAFVGPLVKNQRDLIGSWSGAGQGKESVSIWQALETKYGANKFSYAKGCNLVGDEAMVTRLNRDGAELTIDSRSAAEMIKEAVDAASQADVVVAVLGEPCSMSGGSCLSQ